MGTELVAGIAGCILVGYWVDSKFETGRTGVIVGAIIGCVGGFYHFLRRAVRMEKESEEAAKRRKTDHADDHRS
jgi:F0F1-type ATP synthase assembly protein I